MSNKMNRESIEKITSLEEAKDMLHELYDEYLGTWTNWTLAERRVEVLEQNIKEMMSENRKMNKYDDTLWRLYNTAVGTCASVVEHTILVEAYEIQKESNLKAIALDTLAKHLIIENGTIKFKTILNENELKIPKDELELIDRAVNATVHYDKVFSK